jgi:NTE family protein
VGACHAFGMTADQIVAASKEISWRKISDFSFTTLGLVSNRSLATYVAGVIGDVRIEDAPIPLAIVATNIETREKVVFREGNLGLALRASTGIPGIFAPTDVHGALLVDGGLVENVPVATLKDLGTTVIIGVNLQAHTSKYRPQSISDVLTISMTILSEHRDARLSEQADILIEPDMSAFSIVRFQDVDGMITAGYMATMQHIAAIREKIGAEVKAAQPTLWERILHVIQ